MKTSGGLQAQGPMPGTRAGAAAAMALVEDFSIEAVPAQIPPGGELAALLPPGTAVYLPALPGACSAATADACRSLVLAGLRPVPHLAARAVSCRRELESVLDEFSGAGADSLLLIAGDADRPAGPYPDSLSILDTGLLSRYGFRRLGFAGHPQGHRIAPAAQVDAALATKARYAARTGTEIWLVSQFTFSAEPVLAWLAALAKRGWRIPVRVGIAGPVKPATLLRYALRCGVVPSARAFGRRPATAVKLLGHRSPDAMLQELAGALALPGAYPVAGIHVFPFGGLRRSAQWLREWSMPFTTVQPANREAAL